MADNFQTNSASGGDVFGADDISSVKYPRLKIIIGADGTNDGDVSSANPLPAVVTNAGTFATQIDGTALTRLTDIETNTDFGAVVGGGVEATALRVTIASDSTGVLSVDDGGGALTVDNGGTFVVQVDGTALTRLTDIETNTDFGAVVGGGTEATALRVTLASDSTGVLSVDDGGGALTVDGTVTAELSATDNAVLDQIELNTDFGTVTGGGVEATALRVTLASDSTGVLSVDDNGGALTVDGTVSATSAGDIAHDGVDSGNPVKVGAYATSSEPTAVASADRVNLIADLVGKLITLPYANPENFLSGTASATDTSNTAVIAAQAAGVRIYVTQISVYNSSATDTFVTIKDGTTSLYVLPAPAAGGCVITLPAPLKTTAATALNFASGASVTTMYVSASGYKGV